MGDLISRQAAIDALGHMMDTDGFRDGWAVSRANVDCMLRALPSAEPEPCEDAVSRNAIIQKLNMMDRYVSEELRLCDTDKKFPKNEVFIVDDVYEEIVENLPSAQPEQWWIPCEKRLPDKNGWYIVTIRNNISYMVNTLYWRNGKGWVDNIRKNMFDLYDIYSKLVGRKINPEDECVYWNLDDVVAWMKLPEAYKEGDSDD